MRGMLGKRENLNLVLQVCTLKKIKFSKQT